MRKALLAAMIFSISGIAQAGELVTDAVITSVGNTSGNGPSFFVIVSGGSGLCTNQFIWFPESAAGDANVFNRAYKSALLALSTGMHVKIHNYSDNTCAKASYIQVSSQ